MIVSCPSCQRNYVVADEQIAGKQFRARCKSCGVEFRLDGMPARDATSDAPAAEPAKFMSATEAYLALQTAPPPSAGNWSVCLSQTDTRRMTTDEVAQALTKGTINSNVFVWKTGMPKWLRLSDVPELMSAAGKPTAKVSTIVADPAGAGKSDAAVGRGASKPAPPARTITASGTQPPPPTIGGVIPARSGQTAPPPPLVPNISPQAPQAPQGASAGPTNGHSAVAAQVSQAQAGASAVRRSTPAPPRRATLDIPVEIELSDTAKPDAPPAVPNAGTAAENAASLLAASAGAASNASASVGGVATPAAPGAEPALSPTVAAMEVVLPPIQGAGNGAVTAGNVGTNAANVGSLAGAAGATVPAAASKWPVQKKYGADSKLSQRGDGTNSSVPASATTTPRESQAPATASTKRRFGAFVAMGVVGVVGVLGGVAGAYYFMKPAMRDETQPNASVAVVAPATHAATPPAATTEQLDAAPATKPEAPQVVDGDSVAAAAEAGKSKSSSSLNASRVTPTTASRTASKLAVVEPRTAAASPNLPPASAADTTKLAKPAVAGTVPFNRDAALAVLGLAAARASSCKKTDGPTGTAKVYVTFDPNGSVVIANVVGAPIAGSGVAQCVANIFRRVKVTPFVGDRQSLAKDITIAP